MVNILSRREKTKKLAIFVFFLLAYIFINVFVFRRILDVKNKIKELGKKILKKIYKDEKRSS